MTILLIAIIICYPVGIYAQDDQLHIYDRDSELKFYELNNLNKIVASLREIYFCFKRIKNLCTSNIYIIWNKKTTS